MSGFDSSTKDQVFMARAIRIAENGRYSTHPNPCVGCVLVREGAVVGEGFHLVAGKEHAEANALLNVAGNARGCTAYVTLEPCSFHGRTPSCAQALVTAGVSRVFVAMLDPDSRNAGKGIRILEEAGIEVITPFMASSAAKLVQGHIRRHTTGRPYVRLKLAMTLDGKTALASGESKWITSKEARADVQRLRAMSAAIVTGVQTVIDDNPRMNVRADELGVANAELCAGINRPVYILDSRRRTPLTSQLLAVASTVVVTTKAQGATLPVEVLAVPAKAERVDLGAVLSELAAREHSEILFECGATLAGSLVSEKLVDEVIFYVAPRLMGSAGRSLLNLPEVDRMSDLAALSISDIRRIGPDFRITASVN